MMDGEARVPSDGHFIYTRPIFWKSEKYYWILINTWK